MKNKVIKTQTKKNPDKTLPHPYGSDSQLQLIINSMADGIVIVDDTGVLKFINPAAEKMFGRQSGELIGEMFGFPLVNDETTEISVFDTRQHETVVEMRTVEIEWESEVARLVSLRDITNRKLTEDAKRHAESLENVRLLAGAIAHEFSQPLQILNHLFEIMELENGSNNRLEKCKSTIERITNLVRQLRNVVILKRREYLHDEILDIAASSSDSAHLVFQMIAEKLNLQEKSQDRSEAGRLLDNSKEATNKNETEAHSRRNEQMRTNTSVNLSESKGNAPIKTPRNSKELFEFYLASHQSQDSDINQILADIDMPVLLVDSDGYIQKLNTQSESIFERSASELQGFYLGQMSTRDSKVDFQIIRKNFEILTVQATAHNFDVAGSQMTMLILRPEQLN